MIRAVLMDMDGVMFDTERLSTVAWTKTSQKYGCPLTREQILNFRGSNMWDNEKKFLELYPGKSETYWTMRKERYEMFFAYIDEHGVPIKPGLYELLNTLKEYNLPVCVATGTARETAEMYWEKTGVKPFFSATICGGEVERSKPDPQVFLLAAEKVGVPPEECMVIEDSPNGLHAARAAGCYTVMVPDESQPDDELLKICDEVLPDLNAVAARIPELIK